MTDSISRRTALHHAVVGTLVFGFERTLRTWLTAADVASGGAARAAPDFPTFQGKLLRDDTALTLAAEDFGHIVHHKPRAVLQPGSVEDIVKLVRFARANKLRVSARGQGHSAFGQAQVEAGVVIDMAPLDRVRVESKDALWAQGGASWLSVVQAAQRQGMSPPVLTDYLGLSVGGTLSLGGIGGQAFRAGVQVDNVLELEVVTGAGERVRCSPTKDAALFDACRSGLGQFGVITGARLRLVKVPARVRTFHAVYADLNAFLADQEKLVDDGRFDYVEGFVAPVKTGGWSFTLEVASYFNPGHEPDDARLQQGLAFLPGTWSSQDTSYFDFANRLQATVDLLIKLGAWGLPHPWADFFLPADQTAKFVSETLAKVKPEDLGQGPVLLYAFNRSRCRAPFFTLPEGKHVFLFDLLRTAVPPSPENVQRLLDQNRELYERARALGGKRYVVGAIPMTRQDWEQQLSPEWESFAAAKRRFDPDGLLAVGQRIFT